MARGRTKIRGKEHKVCVVCENPFVIFTTGPLSNAGGFHANSALDKNHPPKLAPYRAVR